MVEKLNYFRIAKYVKIAFIERNLSVQGKTFLDLGFGSQNFVNRVSTIAKTSS